MALFKKDRGGDSGDLAPGSTGRTSAPASEPARESEPAGGKTMAGQPATMDKSPSAEAGKESAMLGRGTRISGKIAFEGAARIDGQIEGEISASGPLVIGESALVNAQINGTSIVVHGKVTGDLTASKKLEIRAPGRVYGNVTTPSLVIEEGVVFEGHCSMGASEGKGERKVTILAKEEGSAPAATPAARIANADTRS